MVLKAKMSWAKAKQDYERGRPLTATEKLANLGAALASDGEYETLNLGQKAAVDEMVRVCRETGQRAERIFPDLVAEVYAYPKRHGDVAWGLNSLNTGENIKRGIVE